ncbi:MAG: hypothetical protein IKA71_03495 [Lentisphaeria bacterium]|nr:hypothetical protein [Lentisphaeria bacterium]
MLGFIIVMVSAVATGAFATREWGHVWGMFCGIGGGVIAWAVLGFILRKSIAGQQNKIQNIMQTAQNKANRQMEMFQRRPPSSEKAARQIMEKIQFEAVRKALDELENFKVFYKWNMLLPKQINTMKVQLYFQLREYEKVDALLPKSLLFDLQSIAIKMVRMYKKGDVKLDKFFKSRVRRFKGDDRAFLASVYAWMMVRQDNAQAALDALLEAKKTSDNQVMLDNIERLSNGKVRHYSNSGFGDIWYALALEEPKVKVQRQMRGF